MNPALQVGLWVGSFALVFLQLASLGVSDKLLSPEQGVHARVAEWRYSMSSDGYSTSKHRISCGDPWGGTIYDYYSGGAVSGGPNRKYDGDYERYPPLSCGAQGDDIYARNGEAGVLACFLGLFPFARLGGCLMWLAFISLVVRRRLEDYAWIQRFLLLCVPAYSLGFWALHAASYSFLITQLVVAPFVVGAMFVLTRKPAPDPVVEVRPRPDPKQARETRERRRRSSRAFHQSARHAAGRTRRASAPSRHHG